MKLANDRVRLGTPGEGRRPEVTAIFERGRGRRSNPLHRRKDQRRLAQRSRVRPMKAAVLLSARSGNVVSVMRGTAPFGSTVGQ
jgi:hypothetical protein